VRQRDNAIGAVVCVFVGGAVRERDSRGGEASGVGETKRPGLFAIFRKWKKEREWMGFEIFGG
jgi:hypothetical protein